MERGSQVKVWRECCRQGSERTRRGRGSEEERAGHSQGTGKHLEHGG